MPVLARCIAAALLVALAACANSPTAPSTPLPAATRTAPPTLTTSPPAPAAAPQAADGSNLASCEDAECEVEVQAGDQLVIDKRFGVRRLTISFLHSDEAGITLSGSSGGLRVEGMNVSVSGSCVNGHCRDEGKLSLTPAKPARINDMRLELTHLADDRAVLRLTPK